LVALRKAARLNGLTGLAVTKLDVLSGFSTIKVCTAYERKGERLTEAPEDLSGLTPVYEELPGWKGALSTFTRQEELPEEARALLEKISEMVEVPVQLISVGPEREATISTGEFFRPR
jgi:adenylosuccinate synthase